MNPARFRHFAAIDWSGAAGERHHGIAVALCPAGDAAPELVRPGHRWSRGEVLEWLTDQLPADTLVGIDLSMSFAHADCGAYFPGWAGSPPHARALWSLVEQVCGNELHLGATTFADHPDLAPHFRRHGGREGAAFGGGRGRFRETEHGQARAGCRPYSNFNLVGAAQVGKGSLAGMRLLHRLSGIHAIWPFDPLPERGSVLVEIYTTLAAIAAGRTAGRSKMRDWIELNLALANLGSKSACGNGPLSDHASDALLAAAWLRKVAHEPALWQPPLLTDQLAQREGWTFGAT
ncbi:MULTISPECIES: hypothetical protein [unclassified Novosphingobium]|uniref:hypothetical protein n=1 Tax=unclassified Novosphingobium TaxID=2644732 RepID=UPI000ECEF57C|nr:MULTISPECIES: hypothetical protein [unclassified Novosphingobium]HCF24513.1 hypothetical protein [Novosphingobium sp.]HQV03326.1 hypothetical protein [Novosphingobium sp.]